MPTTTSRERVVRTGESSVSISRCAPSAAARLFAVAYVIGSVTSFWTIARYVL
jgi:hypothetical protein